MRYVVAETNRILLRELTLDDVPQLALILADPDVMRYSVRGVCTEEDTRQFVEWCIALYRDSGYGPWALVEKASSALVGFCGLSPELIDGKQEIQIGYRLARKFWGQGLATEAVSRVLAHAFEHERLGSVVAIIEPGHEASARVAEKAGFRAFVWAHYHDREVKVYRKTLAEWNEASHNHSLNPT
jgi:[ribosomal protein S5]-alanine N-acetyltransferase